MYHVHFTKLCDIQITFFGSVCLYVFSEYRSFCFFIRYDCLHKFSSIYYFFLVYSLALETNSTTATTSTTTGSIFLYLDEASIIPWPLNTFRLTTSLLICCKPPVVVCCCLYHICVFDFENSILLEHAATFAWLIFSYGKLNINITFCIQNFNGHEQLLHMSNAK